MGLSSLFSPVYKPEKFEKNMKKPRNKIPPKKRHSGSSSKSDRISVKSGKKSKKTKKVIHSTCMV